MPAIQLTNNIRVGQQKPLDDKYLNNGVVYTSAADAIANVIMAERHIGLTVNVNNVEYWFSAGITDGNLVAKQASGTITSSNYTAPNSLLVANAAATPIDITLAEQTVLGRVTGGNITALSISSDLTTTSLNHDTIPSAKATKKYVDDTITGALTYQGGYDANTNAPALDASITLSIKKGWTYTVTVTGNFFTSAVEPGDMLISNQDTPTTLAHWTVVNKNIDVSTTSVAGTIRTATSAEVIAGTITNAAIVPSDLKTLLGTSSTLTMPRKYTATLGATTSTTLTHGLNTLATIVMVYDTTNLNEVMCDVVNASVNTTIFNFSVAPTAGQYTAVIIG